MTRSDLIDLQVIYQTATERAVCVRETEDSPGGQRRSRRWKSNRCPRAAGTWSRSPGRNGSCKRRD